jgi:hypothetical protein
MADLARAGRMFRLCLEAGSAACSTDPDGLLVLRMDAGAALAATVLPWTLSQVMGSLAGRKGLGRDDLQHLLELAEAGCLDARGLRLATRVIRGTRWHGRRERADALKRCLRDARRQVRTMEAK